MSFWPLLVALLPIFASGQSAVNASDDSKACFSITVRKDFTVRPSPLVVTFLDVSGKVDVSQDHGNYCIPFAWKDRKLLDLTFVVGKNRLYLPSMHADGLYGSLLISYVKKEAARMGSDHKVKSRAPCTIVFQRGEPEIGEVINPCVFKAKPLQ